MEHPTAERSRALPLDPLRLRRRRDGIPAPLVTPHDPGLVLESSWSGGPPEAPVVDRELGNPAMVPWSGPWPAGRRGQEWTLVDRD